MTDSRRRTRHHAKRVKKRIALAAAAIFLVYIIGSFGRLHYLNYVEQRHLNVAKKQQEELRREMEELKREKRNLEDIDYLKDYARRKLFLMEEGEIPIRITNAPWDEQQAGGEQSPR